MPPRLILLPGAMKAIEGSGAVRQGLAGSREVVPFDYRADDHLPSLLARIAAASGDGPVDLLGQSYGGWIGQCFARAHPGRVRRMILSHSFVLRPSDIVHFHVGRWLLRHVPDGMLARLLLTRIRKALDPVRRQDRARFERQVAAIRGQVGDRAVLDVLAAQQECLRESVEQPFASLPPVDPATKILIIESRNDKIVGRAARERLRHCYPTAAFHMFEDAGHVSAIVATDEYLEIVRAFLD